MTGGSARRRLCESSLYFDSRELDADGVRGGVGAEETGGEPFEESILACWIRWLEFEGTWRKASRSDKEFQVVFEYLTHS